MRSRLILATFAILLLASTWVANQGGPVPTLPAKFAAGLYLNLASLLPVGAAWVGALGLGWPLRRLLVQGSPHALVSQAGLGMAALLLGNWLLWWAGVTWGLTALCAAGAAAGAAQLYLAARPRAGREEPPAGLPWAAVLAALPLGTLLVATTLPPGTLWRVEAYGYDVLSYHLQIPREWIAAGGMVPLRHNVYSFLPGLVEAGFAGIATMPGGGGSVVASVYACQLFHASLAVYAAIAIGAAVAQLSSPPAGCVAAATFLAAPWTLVTGSMAYNEMAVVAFGAAAVLVLLDIRSETPRGAAAIGFLVGAATLAKPTAGFLVAVPVGVVLLTRLNHAVRWRSPPDTRKAVIAAGVAASVGLATLAPYLARNYAWTGNPVFPFATGLLGAGHWDAELAERWDRGHGLAWDREQPLADALVRQWLLNTGYGALGGQPTPIETRNIARFPREYGWPILWAAMLVAALLTVRQRRLRRAVGAMLLILGLQLAFWLAATHHQSRFLVPTLLPASVIIGIGYARLLQLTAERGRWLPPLAAVALVGPVWLSAQSQLHGQANPSAGRAVLRALAADGLIPADAAESAAPSVALVDALPLVSYTPFDDLRPDDRVLLVADNSGLLYIDPPILYNTAFDANPLGEIMRERGGDPAAVTAALRERGITHVWAHWSELARLHGTYGFDDDVTEPALRELARRWRVVRDAPAATLYAIP